MAIKILDYNLINRISAGEVIERPASIVKELIENSIDANATQITIEVTDGGKKQIKISDNGCGMNEEDAKLCIKRHATSKIGNVDDLFSIKTLGFRGEALSSIAAVSNLKLITKTEDEYEGTFVEAEEDNFKIKKIACNPGTIVEVNDIFFNMPVRKKYLKASAIELNYIIDIVARYALANPEIYFKLVSDGNIILSSPNCQDLYDGIVSVYGKDIAKELLEIKYTNEIKIHGYVSKPSLTRKDRSQQSIFINKRYVKNKTVSDALYSAYHTLLFTERHPIAVIMVEMDYSKTDVNIHPTKHEIKVKDEAELYEAVYNAVKDALEKNKEKEFSNVSVIADKSVQNILKIGKEDVEVKEEKRIAEPLKIIGQFGKTYILAEDRDLVLIDQHAAQERVNYERFMKQYKNENIVKQELINPLVLDLTVTEASIVKNNMRLFSKLGFELEEYGTYSFLLRSLPSIFGRLQKKDIIADMVNEIGVSENEMDEIKEERIIRFACRKSIKAGEELNLIQVKELVNNLYASEQPFTCPHGRPTIIRFSVKELEKKFRRVPF